MGSKMKLIGYVLAAAHFEKRKKAWGRR